MTRSITHAFVRRHVLQGKPNPPHMDISMEHHTHSWRRFAGHTSDTAAPNNEIEIRRCIHAHMLMSFVKQMHRLANRRVHDTRSTVFGFSCETAAPFRERTCVRTYTTPDNARAHKTHTNNPRIHTIHTKKHFVSFIHVCRGYKRHV